MDGLMSARVLVVNADDFGQSPGVNVGVIRAHEHGIVTSATLMVRWPAAREAAGYARRHPTLSLGLHLDLGEWEYRDDDWHVRYMVIPTDDAEAVAGEVERQLDRFHSLVGRVPTHLDSHQHVHRASPVREALVVAGERLGVPVRDATPLITYNGKFHGQSGRGHPVPEAISVTSLVTIIRELPPGITELGCHPGEGDLDSTYARERSMEVQTLCDPRVREALKEADVQLRSFKELQTP